MCIYIYMQYNHRGSFSIREFRVYAICRITRTWEKRGFFFDRITRIAQRLNQIYFLFLAILFFNAVRIFIIYTRLRRLNTGKLLDDQKNVKEKLSRMIVKIVDIFLLFLAYEWKKYRGRKYLTSRQSSYVEIQTSNYSTSRRIPLGNFHLELVAGSRVLPNNLSARVNKWKIVDKLSWVRILLANRVKN